MNAYKSFYRQDLLTALDRITLDVIEAVSPYSDGATSRIRGIMDLYHVARHELENDDDETAK